MTPSFRILSPVLPFLTLAFSAACKPQPATCQAPAPSAGVQPAIETGNAEFASDLLTQLAGQQSGNNFFYSPYSISAALAMTYAGAATTTAQQMAQVLHLQTSAQDVPLGYAQLDCQLTTQGQANNNQLDIANGLFGQQGFSFQPAFLSVLQNDYGAPLQQVDFANNASGATQTIDQWVSAQTQGLIPELFSPGSLTSSTRLVLADAIYFKGNWASAFNAQYTMPAPFIASSTQTVQAPLMQQTANFGYMTGQGFSMLELPYAGGQLAMDVLLPSDVDGLPALVSAFSAASFSSWVAQLQSTKVQVTLPKFSLQSSFNLNQTLIALGMTLAFDPTQADFSGMDGQHDLYIGLVVHQANVEVDESGSVAAAATGVAVLAGDAVSSNPPQVTFNANHPFLIVLRDLSTGTLLFLGQLTNPSQS
jgi:serpin B